MRGKSALLGILNVHFGYTTFFSIYMTVSTTKLLKPKKQGGFQRSLTFPTPNWLCLTYIYWMKGIKYTQLCNFKWLCVSPEETMQQDAIEKYQILL